MKTRILYFFLVLSNFLGLAQNPISLDVFMEHAKTNAPTLQDNANRLKLGTIQNAIITAKNRAVQINATSEIMVSPYFNNDGNAVDITTAPTDHALGYDAGITNGGLYSAQVNLTKRLFNKTSTERLLFQNKVQNSALSLASDSITHKLEKTITDAYILAYQYQLQVGVAQEILKDLEKRLQVVDLLVKRAVLTPSDYLLLQSEVQGKQLELQQIQTNRKAAVNQLYTLSGLAMDSITRLEPPLISYTEHPNHFFYEKKFENDSLQIVANQQVYNNQYKPQVTAYANAGLNAVEFQNMYRKFGASVGLRLKIPIYDGKLRHYNTQQNLLKTEILTGYKKYTKIQINNKLTGIKQQIQDLNKAKVLMDEQLKNQQKILEVYKGKLVQGQISILDYLNVIQKYKVKIYTKLQIQTNQWLLQSLYNSINW